MLTPLVNILDTCKKTYLMENSSTKTEAEYQWMHGAYIHVTGSNANAMPNIPLPYHTIIKSKNYHHSPNLTVPDAFCYKLCLEHQNLNYYMYNIGRQNFVMLR